MTTTTVTRRKAEAVLNAVKATYAAYLNGAGEADQPKLWLADDFFPDGGQHWQVSWESGPFEWALNFSAAAGTDYPVEDPELTSLASDFGVTKRVTHRAPKLPAGVSVQCDYSFALGVYPD